MADLGSRVAVLMALREYYLPSYNANIDLA